MTATRVIDDHRELENVGTLTHASIDSYINDTAFIVYSGSLEVPSGSRQLQAGSGITIVDGGPGSTVVISSTVTSSAAAGATGQVQYNSGGFFAATGSFTFDPVAGALSSPIVSGSLTTLADGSPYLIGGSNIVVLKNPNGSLTISSTTSPGVGGSGTKQVMSWNDGVTGDVDGFNMVFQLSNSPDPLSSLMFYVNGVLQKQGVDGDYFLSGTTVAMNYAPTSDSSLAATYSYVIPPPPGSSIAWSDVPLGAVDGVNQVFVLEHTPVPPEALMFHHNGVLQRAGIDYFLSGSTVTMTYVPPSGGSMLATYPY